MLIASSSGAKRASDTLPLQLSDVFLSPFLIPGFWRLSGKEPASDYPMLEQAPLAVGRKSSTLCKQLKPQPDYSRRQWPHVQLRVCALPVSPSTRYEVYLFHLADRRDVMADCLRAYAASKDVKGEGPPVLW